jgi:uncharacterized C2H2 Zn-finger protein
MHTCPKCGAPLEQVYSPEGISEKCPQCDYHHDELADLSRKADKAAKSVDNLYGKKRLDKMKEQRDIIKDEVE